MKKAYAWVCLLLIFLLCSCDSRPLAGICFRQTEDPVTALLEKQLVQALEAEGYRVETANARQDQALQHSQIRRFMEKEADILMVEPVITAEEAAIAEAAEEEDVPLIFLNDPPEKEMLDDGRMLCYVGSDHTQAGYLQGVLVAALPDGGDKNQDGVVSYLVISGPEDYLDAAGWAEDCGAAIPGEQLALEYGDWSMESGERIAGRALSRFGRDLEVIFCHSGEMALGALEAAQAQDREVGTDLEIVGIGGDGQLWEEIRMGNITGTVCPDTRALTDAVVRAASGREVQQVTLAELIRVTRENTDQFLGG